MSYTIASTPANLSSIHADLVFTVLYPEHTSDPVTYPNYKFVGDVYVGATLVARIKKVPDPTNSVGIFNIGNIVRNYIASTFNAANSLISQRQGNGEYTLAVTMKFGEEYSYTTYTNLVVDSVRTYFNNYNGRLIGNTTSLSGLSDKPITTRPYQTPVRSDATYHLIPYLPSTTGVITITVSSYDYSNSIYNTTSFTVTPAAAYELIILNLSQSVIEAYDPGTIDANVKYYIVEFGTGGETYRFDVDYECVYDQYTLHFMNKYGGFESKDFTKVSRKTIQIEKKDFGKLPYTVDNSGQVSYKNANNIYNETRSVYASQFKEKMTLNSDFLTDEEYTWLEELVLSPMVYIQDGAYFFPVVISETNYEPKKKVNDELSNLTINIEYGDQLNTQFR